MTAYEMTDETIAKLKAAGANRWSKGNHDRLYINVKDLGAEISYYKTGNVSNAIWRGETVSNADGRRLLGSKVYVDVKDGSLHVSSSFDEDEIREAAEEFISSALAEDIESVEHEAASYEEAIEMFADEMIAHKGESQYLFGIMNEIERRFGKEFDEISADATPLLKAKLDK